VSSVIVAIISVTELMKMRQEKQSSLAAVALLIFIIALLKGNVHFVLWYCVTS
jgi:hypothetical protein